MSCMAAVEIASGTSVSFTPRRAFAVGPRLSALMGGGDGSLAAA